MAAVLVALMALAAVIDYAASAASVPELATSCGTDHAASCSPSPADVQHRLQRSFELADANESRTWTYVAAALLAVGGAALAEWRTRSTDRRRELFTDLGVLGVGSLVLVAILLLIASGGSLETASGPGWAFGLILVVAAALGAVLTRAGSGVAPGPSEAGTGARVGALARGTPWYSWLALVLAALSVVFALVYAGQVPNCTGEAIPDSASGWAWAATACGAGAMAVGLGALAKRRWIAALASLVLGAGGLLIAALSGLC